MVGYLKPDFKGTPKEDKREYKSFYCGLCKALKSQYSYLGVLNLNYEITAFLILLSGLREEKNKVFHGSCTITPFAPVSYIDYFQDDFICAANLSILISHYEIKDNLQDIGGLKWKVINKLMAKKVNKSISFLQDDFIRIDNAVNSYYKTEIDESATFQDILEGDGNLIESFLSPLVKNYDDETSASLFKLANLLGQWIYLVDACDDLNDDIKNGSFNPLLLMDDSDDINNNIQSIEKKISTIINSLPLMCYHNLIAYIFIDNLQKVSRKVMLKFKRTIFDRKEQ